MQKYGNIRKGGKGEVSTTVSKPGKVGGGTGQVDRGGGASIEFWLCLHKSFHVPWSLSGYALCSIGNKLQDWDIARKRGLDNFGLSLFVFGSLTQILKTCTAGSLKRQNSVFGFRRSTRMVGSAIGRTSG